MKKIIFLLLSFGVILELVISLGNAEMIEHTSGVEKFKNIC